MMVNKLGRPPVRGQAQIDHFWERVNIWGNCWEWEGATDARGYGILRSA